MYVQGVESLKPKALSSRGVKLVCSLINLVHLPLPLYLGGVGVAELLLEDALVARARLAVGTGRA